ncbi:hypothetical protein EBE87_09875 [Pseudoroseomonas wenyumeiae]|uniref:Uncharacterized protein n=1 Tax=Teichococcus wenyumeiae TaxID=2478470 RepID=A0A3A9JE32_9PROT|nr:hypothetical protein [Pseudoroseomonas wenyumeiae]RKK02933.1 hypothetical protein D6Z83_17250 [Pseudoroseomonas wenyumeiae]RMI25431.1 hypothetical protein EBE87_09875 [Pseudoroseomonas wenyumeiae]
MQAPVRDLPEKLRATLILLGLGGQKELCAAFRRINPATGFDLDRSYKWMQGRTLPRSPRVYEDWALVLGLERPGSWLAACSLEEFLDAAAARHPAATAALERASTPQAQPLPEAYLLGHYASYSHAQSPYYRGRLIRGSLVVEPAARRAEGLVATYAQSLVVGAVFATGPVLSLGGSLCLDLRMTSAGVAPVFLSLFHPTPPGSALAGMMCPTTAIDPAGQPPYATRIVLLRLRPGQRPEASNRYLEAGAASLPEDLAQFGLPGAELAPLLRECLEGSPGAPGSDHMPAAAYTALVAACDRRWLP